MAPSAKAVIPNSIYGFRLNDYVTIASGGTYENGLSSAIVTTSLTATFTQPHAGTSRVGYYIATTSATAITKNSTTSITVADATNIVVGQTLKLHGTGTESALTDDCPVTSVSGTTIGINTVSFANSYANTVNLSNATYLPASTSPSASLPSQVLSATGAVAAGITAGDLVLLQPLTGNAANGTFAASPEVAYVQAVATNSITVSPTLSTTLGAHWAVVPFTETTSVTAVTAAGAATITLTSATGFITAQTYTNMYVWGGTGGVTETVQITAVTSSTFTATWVYSHIGAYTLSSGAAAPAGGTTFVEPFELRGGDTVTLARVASGTGITTPASIAELEFVPNRILK